MSWDGPEHHSWLTRFTGPFTVSSIDYSRVSTKRAKQKTFNAVVEKVNTLYVSWKDAIKESAAQIKLNQIINYSSYVSVSLR